LNKYNTDARIARQTRLENACLPVQSFPFAMQMYTIDEFMQLIGKYGQLTGLSILFYCN